MSTQERIDVANGKYTVIIDNGRLSALRYGGAWRDLSGDNLVYYLAIELQQARDIVQALLTDLGDAATTLRAYQASHLAKAELLRSISSHPGDAWRVAESLHKAEVNGALAARFQATIDKAVSPDGA